MFENLTEKLGRTLKNLAGMGALSEKNMAAPFKEVKEALIEADVALPVVDYFITDLKQHCLGQTIPKGLAPEQFLIKQVNEALVQLMGAANESLDLKAPAPVVILMAGLQGVGKTTMVGKLAKRLKEQEKRSVMVASCDVYRPAAIKQLQVLAEEVGVLFFETDERDPEKIARAAVQAARRANCDVLLLDTAGRSEIDGKMMDEIKILHQAVSPTETLFVVDSMTGQSAANTAKAFHDALPLTGVILTKVDGDARGGAALSVRHITGKPIKFLGVGEKLDALELFHPDRLASRILGMGDMLSLIETIEQKVDQEKANKIAQKIQKGRFDLEDFKAQLIEMENMGGMMGLMDKLPGMGSLPEAMKNKLVQDQSTVKMIALIDSMTLTERRRPDLVKNKGSRKRRIVNGSGTTVPDLNRLLKQFVQMQKMMKKFKNKAGMMKMMQGLQERLPPGLFG